MIALLRSSLLKRMGFWALLQSLPDEAAFKAYLRYVFMGLSTAIIASILAGCVMVFCLSALYQALMFYNMGPWVSTSVPIGIAVLLTVLFATLSYRSFKRINEIKATSGDRNFYTSPSPSVLSVVDAVKNGFIEGLFPRK